MIIIVLLIIVNKLCASFHVEWISSVQECTVGSSVQAGEQGVNRECANVYKLYTSSMSNLDTVLGN